jgi:hypothetical protein
MLAEQWKVTKLILPYGREKILPWRSGSLFNQWVRVDLNVVVCKDAVCILASELLVPGKLNNLKYHLEWPPVSASSRLNLSMWCLSPPVISCHKQSMLHSD